MISPREANILNLPLCVARYEAAYSLDWSFLRDGASMGPHTADPGRNLVSVAGKCLYCQQEGSQYALMRVRFGYLRTKYFPIIFYGHNKFY